MSSIATITLWGKALGAVVWDEKRELGVFEYDPKFLKSPLPVSPIHLPLREGAFIFNDLARETFYGLPGLLSDSLPDRFGQSLIRRWMEMTGRSSMNPVEKLSYIGARGMGALEFKPALRGAKGKSEKIKMNALADLAEEIVKKREGWSVDLKANERKALAQIIQIGSSAGGARAKALVAWNEHSGEMKSGQVKHDDGFGYWLLKFDSRKATELGDPEGFGRVEFAYNQMASDCEIKIPQVHLLEENESGRAHFMCKRFDRGAEGEKIHMLTLCGLAHYDFNKQWEYSYEQVMNLMLKLKLPHSDIEEFYRRMVFNVVARNQDDHTRNTAFLMDRNGQWRLSPSYDICWSYNEKWVAKHQLQIQGKSDHFTVDDFEKVAGLHHITGWKRILRRTNEVVSAWGSYAKKARVPEALAGQIQETLRLNLK